MGSLTPSGTAISQVDARFRIANGKEIKKVVVAVDGSTTTATIDNSSISTNRAIFTADATASGNLEHDVTRNIAGIHVSVSHRESLLQQNKTGAQIASGVPGDIMQSITERKIFFLDSDRNKTSGFSDLTIFNAGGEAVGGAAGTTDTDVTPNV